VLIHIDEKGTAIFAYNFATASFFYDILIDIFFFPRKVNFKLINKFLFRVTCLYVSRLADIEIGSNSEMKAEGLISKCIQLKIIM